MKKNEQQPQETAAVAADAPAAQENEAAAQQPAQTEESAPDAGGEIAVADDGPIDENQDPTFVPVTVLVVATSAANNYLLLRHCLRSLQKNLRGVDAQVKVVGAERPDWLDCESWLSDAAGEFNHLNELVARALPHVETNRVILMTDRMLLARPVTLADIALMKALPEGGDLPTLRRYMDQHPKNRRKQLCGVGASSNHSLLPPRDLLAQLREAFRAGYAGAAIYPFDERFLADYALVLRLAR